MLRRESRKDSYGRDGRESPSDDNPNANASEEGQRTRGERRPRRTVTFAEDDHLRAGVTETHDLEDDVPRESQEEAAQQAYLREHETSLLAQQQEDLRHAAKQRQIEQQYKQQYERLQRENTGEYERGPRGPPPPPTPPPPPPRPVPGAPGMYQYAPPYPISARDATYDQYQYQTMPDGPSPPWPIALSGREEEMARAREAARGREPPNQLSHRTDPFSGQSYVERNQEVLGAQERMGTYTDIPPPPVPVFQGYPTPEPQEDIDEPRERERLAVGPGFGRAAPPPASPAASQQYDSSVDEHTIYPGLTTAMGSHQGSMLKAMNAAQRVKRAAAKMYPRAGNPGKSVKSGGGVIMIKKLLLKRAIGEAMKNPRGFDAAFDETYLEARPDTDPEEKIQPLIESATNISTNTQPYVKWPSCAVIYLDNCSTHVFDILDANFELRKSNWGAGDEGFVRWATGTENDPGHNDGSESPSLRHNADAFGDNNFRWGLFKNTRDGRCGRPTERIPQSFAWEPFGFVHDIELGKYHNGAANIRKRAVRRVLFTFEFLVPYPCMRDDCEDGRTLLQIGTDVHVHTFIQRRTILVQTSTDPAEPSRKPSADYLCIVADLPITSDGQEQHNMQDNRSHERDFDSMLSEEEKKREAKIRFGKLFFGSTNSSKYRFRPSFRLKDSSEKWYTPAFVYFIIKDVIECWQPLVHRCIEHVEYREQSVLANPTSEEHTSELWKDRQHWIYLRSILDAHVANVSRLKSYVAETFQTEQEVVTELFGELQNRIGEVEKKIEKQLKERTDNLVDLVFNAVNSHDAHVSAETGISMWRLSWITFVFLPLTFLAGIFGMNVNSFSKPENVKIQWYFVVAFAMLVVVIAVIWILKKKIGYGFFKKLREGWKNRQRRRRLRRAGSDIESNDDLLNPLFTEEYLNSDDIEEKDEKGDDSKQAAGKVRIIQESSEQDDDDDDEISPVERERVSYRDDRGRDYLDDRVRDSRDDRRRDYRDDREWGYRGARERDRGDSWDDRRRDSRDDRERDYRDAREWDSRDDRKRDDRFRIEQVSESRWRNPYAESVPESDRATSPNRVSNGATVVDVAQAVSLDEKSPQDHEGFEELSPEEISSTDPGSSIVATPRDWYDSLSNKKNKENTEQETENSPESVPATPKPTSSS